jgi:hypothetical protein
MFALPSLVPTIILYDNPACGVWLSKEGVQLNLILSAKISAETIGGAFGAVL